MKNSYSILILTITLSLLPLFSSQAQTFSGNAYLDSQFDVDAFGANGYTEITGELFIGYNNGYQLSDINDLTPLSTITTIGGDITVQSNGQLQSLNGLHNINTMDGTFVISNNPNLLSLDDLSEINDSSHKILVLIIQYNPSLTNLNGVEGLTCANIILDGNSGLNSLSGLQSIDTIGTFHMEGCNQITSLQELGNISYMSNIFLRENEGLTSLDGIETMGHLGFMVSIKNNTNLTDFCALNSLIDSSGFSTYDVVQNAYNPSFQDLLDGNCSPNIGLNESTVLDQIILSPNPTYGVVNLDFGTISSKNIRILNQLGQVVYQEDHITESTLEIKLDLPCGIYMVDIESEGLKKQFKVIKQ